jgi:2-hydroxymuconate-semialdehyde hydrolase
MTIGATTAAHTVVTSAGRIAFHDEGDGPPVLLLHGFPASSWQWREFVPLLASRFRVIAPDLLGAGASAPADGARLNLATHAGALGELMSQLRIERYAVVAHGMGAGVAQLLALDGDGVDAMVLLSAAALDAWPSTGVERARAHRGEPTPDLVRRLVRTAIETGAVRRERLPDDVLDAYAEPYATGDGPARFVRVLEGLDGAGLSERSAELSLIDAPVLILWGEDDVVYPASVGERLNDAMPSSTLGLLPGCGHFLVEEAPDTIAPMISEYLRARYAHTAHGHDGSSHGHGDASHPGIVMLQLERRPPWVDLEEDERDDWFEPDASAEPGEPGTAP